MLALEDLYLRVIFMSNGRPSFWISRYPLSSWISYAIILKDGILNIVNDHFKPCFFFVCFNFGVNSHPDQILVDLWWEMFTSNFEMHRRKSHHLANRSTKKKYPFSHHATLQPFFTFIYTRGEFTYEPSWKKKPINRQMEDGQEEKK